MVLWFAGLVLWVILAEEELRLLRRRIMLAEEELRRLRSATPPVPEEGGEQSEQPIPRLPDPYAGYHGAAPQ